MHKAFEVHMLNDQGKEKAKRLAELFDGLLSELTSAIGIGGSGRESALVTTHLELASFYAKKAMAQLPENNQP